MEERLRGYGSDTMMRVVAIEFIPRKNALYQFNVRSNLTQMKWMFTYLRLIRLRGRGRKASASLLHHLLISHQLKIHLGKTLNAYQKQKVVLSVYELNRQLFNVFELVKV